MKKRMIVASNNKGKIQEIKQIFSDFDIITIGEIEEQLNKKITLIEDKDTFKDNAIQKVKRLISEIDENILCMADDSGLSIDALNGFPGVKTARWLDGSDHDKNIELLKLMKNEKNRSARAITAIAIGDKNLLNVVECYIDGKIANQIAGNNGFGFDEIFELDNGRTLAELSSDEKNIVSARKEALNKIKTYIY